MNARLPCSTDTNDVPETRQLVLDRPEIGKRGGLDDGDAGSGVAEAVFQGIGAEEVRQRQRDRAHLENRHVGDRGLRALRQQQRDAVAGHDAEALERVRQAVGRALDVAEGIACGRAGLVFPMQRDPRGIRSPLAAAVPRDVVALRNVPAKALVELFVAVQHGAFEFNIQRIVQPPMLKALVFDAYGTLFDVHSVARRCESFWPGKGAVLSQAWRAKQLEYTWLHSLMRRYRPFSQITREALAYACQALDLSLDGIQVEALMGEYQMLAPYPDVEGFLKNLSTEKR